MNDNATPTPWWVMLIFFVTLMAIPGGIVGYIYHDDRWLILTVVAVIVFMAG